MIVIRLAPAPTGFLHLGHVVNAIYVWGIARMDGGHGLLRIEDHDRKRCRPESSVPSTDLTWLGILSDLAPVRQSHRHDVYDGALARLRRKGLSTRASVPQRDRGGERAGRRTEVPGTCAAKGLIEGPGRGTRVRLEPSINGSTTCVTGDRCSSRSIKSAIYWPETATPMDLSVRRHGGRLRPGVTLVVRGDDRCHRPAADQSRGFSGETTPTRFFASSIADEDAGPEVKQGGRRHQRGRDASGWTDGGRRHRSGRRPGGTARPRAPIDGRRGLDALYRVNLGAG